jgi:hypothetical protein
MPSATGLAGLARARKYAGAARRWPQPAEGPSCLANRMVGRVRGWSCSGWLSGGLVTGSWASAALRSWARPFLRAGEAASEFPEVVSIDQLARGGVTAWWRGPVIAGCAAAPDPPPRVLAPEPLKLGILVIPASAGVHGVFLQAAGGRPRGRARGWGRAGAWMVRAAVQLLPSPCNLPGRLPGSRCSGGQPRRAARRVIPLTTRAAGCGRIRCQCGDTACAIC